MRGTMYAALASRVLRTISTKAFALLGLYPQDMFDLLAMRTKGAWLKLVAILPMRRIAENVEIGGSSWGAASTESRK